MLIDDDILTEGSREVVQSTKQAHRLEKTIKQTLNAFENGQRRHSSDRKNDNVYTGFSGTSHPSEIVKIPSSKQGLNRIKRNTREYVCSILQKENSKNAIEFSPQRVINRTSTKWMKKRVGLQNSNSRPSTTKIIEATKIRSQTAQKDSSVRRTTASTGNNLSNHRFKNHIKYQDGQNFLFQNSWIPKSYRKEPLETPGDRNEGMIPKKIPTNKPFQNTISAIRDPSIISSNITIQGNDNRIKKIIPGMEKPVKIEKKESSKKAKTVSGLLFQKNWFYYLLNGL